MGERSAIQWCDSTVNGQMGCDGCELYRPAKRDPLSSTGYEVGAVRRDDGTWWILICYAAVQTINILSNGPRKGWPPSFDQPTIFSERIAKAAAWKDLTGTKREGKPWLDGMPRVIFFNDMGDTWTASLPLDWLVPYLPIIARSPHIWLILTKRPDRAAEFSRLYQLPSNVWIGASITSAQDARLRALDRVRAAVTFVSYEPTLADAVGLIRQHPRITWWIFGGASGTSAPPTDLGVLHAGVAACREVGAAPFVKQLGARPFDPARTDFSDRVGEWGRLINGDPRFYRMLQDAKGGDWNEWTGELAALRVREFPTVAA